MKSRLADLCRLGLGALLLIDASNLSAAPDGSPVGLGKMRSVRILDSGAISAKPEPSAGEPAQLDPASSTSPPPPETERQETAPPAEPKQATAPAETSAPEREMAMTS